MDKIKKELLDALKKLLETDEDTGEVSVFSSDELGAPADILRAELPEFGPDLVSVLGEFFFIPFEDDELLYFSSVITISSTVPEAAVPEVAAAVARLNYYLPCGCYALGDNDKNLIYRYTALIDSSDDREKQKAAVSTAALASIFVAEKFMGNLLLVIRNEMTVDEMVEMLKAEK